MSPEDLDALPFGVVRLNEQLEVVAYNQAEARLSGLEAARVLGRRFFPEVAPCMDNAMVAERYQAPAELDHELDYVLAFRMRPMKARLRLLARAGRAWSYLCVRQK